MDILNPTFVPIYEKKIQEQLNNEFKRLEGECYTDHAGATLHSDSQMVKIYQDLSSNIYPNPHSGGGSGNLTQEITERTRYRILDFFNASSDDYSLVFTSGTTASLKCIAETFKFKSTNQFKGNFVYLQDNHTSVLGMRDVVAQKEAEVKCLNHDAAFDVFSKNSEQFCNHSETTDNSLFVYPAQCNFSGFKYPLTWINQVHKGMLNKLINRKSNWFVLLDAACFVGTNRLDLAIYKPDFVVISFYKMFGYPTGIGALIVKNTSIDSLEKIYYGGGTVNMTLSLQNYHVKREVFHERFEDGTISFLSIISLQHGFDALSMISMDNISNHVFSLAQYLHHSLLTLHHHNGNPVVKLYTDSGYQNKEFQGGIVAFNILRSTGEYVGYMEVLHMAALFKIHLRTGCFCNPGTCQRHLNLSNKDVMNNYDSGVKCGGGIDLVNGKPTGAVRISFGYMSTIEDVKTILLMIRKCFLDSPEVRKIPRWYEKKSITWSNQYQDEDVEADDYVENKEKIKQDIRKNSETFKNANIDGENKFLKLCNIFIYPIKSCGAFKVENSWILTSKGLQYDREWMITTAAGICLTQKQEVMLCLIKPIICLQNKVMKLDYPGMPTIQIPLDDTPKDRINGEMCRSRVCGHRVEGVDCGIEVGEWLSLALGRPNLKLIRQHNFDKPSMQSKPELSFSSQAQYLLINKASIEWLADKISEDSDCDKNSILDRFRGNLIVEGGLPFEEYSWTQVKIGKEIFEVNGPCTRCQMVCVDQNTGQKTVEPLRLLAEEFHGKMKFGIYLNER
ncbi:molybdenum cofactor sulfurase isoform X2 [Chelonus insularis]|uniref:molybdenum cofactor sulfurase isoform X2 n=1 Tax=Chelonus insularis TaxID=460826 RepID=UPI00158CDBF1|nr:molybdenum cofactor sulfurase isoform X2 [Chelonus insularis]